MRKILITGKSSYVGKNFEEWIRKNYSSEMSVDSISVKNEEWKKKISDYDVILHVAGLVHKKNIQNTKEYFEVNRDLTLEVAKKAKESGVKHFVFLSSMSVYGIETGEINSDSATKPNGAYGKSKLEAEKLLLQLSSKEFMISIVRAPMIYGPDCPGNYQRLRSFSLYSPFFPNIKNKRSMIFIDNLSEFIKMTIEERWEGILFPQNAEYVCTSKLVKKIAEINGRKIYVSNKFNFISYFFKNKSLYKKVFGTLIYNTQTKENVLDYCRYTFEESLEITERGRR